MKRYLLCLLAVLSFSVASAQNYNFLGSYTADGTPEYFDEKDSVSPETLSMIADALPESFPVPQYNPQYITSGYDTDVILNENADVWVTFVAEGAGYRNVLGFYTYDINNPLTQAPSPEDITIIFPNVSAKNSGGSLEAGHKVKIGTFSAGTGIGWVLLANGWNGSQVTSGLWQLYSGTAFNPEPLENLRHHNVLLNDPDNERIILGFEDIRRDYASCDNDFNDALFYISANPYTAIKTTNFNKITDHTDVSSGNDGGLESNGDLASLIAKRNFDRNKNNTFKNTQKRQSKYSKKTYKGNAAIDGSLNAYFPETGMFGDESTYISSPDDLLAITNASRIFSIDYYRGYGRVAAALATETVDGVYNHTKTICDRLNDSKLLDVRTVELQGHELVYTQLERANGDLEYALLFSAKIDADHYTVYSFWNLDQYPAGDYINFQVWGHSMGQVSTMVNHIIEQLNEEKAVNPFKTENILPTVFIKNGFYKNGKLHLNVVNSSKARSLNINSNYKATEQSGLSKFSKSISLNGNWEEEVIVDTGFLFDAGISIKGDNSPQIDALYLADGPWGVDYNAQADSIGSFEITKHEGSVQKSENYMVERGVALDGEVKETINIFRNLLAGDRNLSVDDYSYLQFSIENDTPIEVSLVTENTADWSNRLRHQISVHDEESVVSLHFSDFTDESGNPVQFSEIKSVVFSVQGDYHGYQEYSLKINSMVLSAEGYTPAEEEVLEETEVAQTTEADLETIEELENNEVKVRNYPNPFTTHTSIDLPKSTSKVEIRLTNTVGAMVYHKMLHTQAGGRTVMIEASSLVNGIYIFTVLDAENGKIYQGKVIKN
ncbi:DUF4114 domain-containing protein [Euzebyella marina]|uniref:DUF4114 domain-containing protein n=1 Tax=Euzebyella marina TaxID=1761453 RepID=A0A3G2L634_9FLAO|nr:DUF4114 domain-containing protein [Euzebyella marina]AYN67696.1 DUF4114 domain-containing protein [Euzebyella marina]